MSDYFQRLRKQFKPFHLLVAMYLLIAIAGVIYRSLK
jgi:hypothetical protein